MSGRGAMRDDRVWAGCAVLLIVGLMAGACDGGGSSTSSSPTPAAPTTPAPTVTAITPSSGMTTGGMSVTIAGTNFTQEASVTIAGVAATTLTVESATSIKAKTGAGNAGTGDVVVTVNGGQAGRLAGGFTYRSQLVLTTYYGGGEPDWSLFTGAKVPNGGAAPDPLGRKGIVWALNPMGQLGGSGGWNPTNLILPSPQAVPFDQFQSWSTDVLLTGTPPRECPASASGIPSLRFKLDLHFGGTGIHSGSVTAGVGLDLHQEGWGAAWGAWSSTATRESVVVVGPKIGLSEWYNIRMDIRVVSPNRVELEYFLNGVSFGKQAPPEWYAVDALNYPSPWRNIVFWGCENTAYLANMLAAR